jgi:hypothetical protein
MLGVIFEQTHGHRRIFVNPRDGRIEDSGFYNLAIHFRLHRLRVGPFIERRDLDDAVFFKLMSVQPMEALRNGMGSVRPPHPSPEWRSAVVHTSAQFGIAMVFVSPVLSDFMRMSLASLSILDAPVSLYFEFQKKTTPKREKV